MFIAQPIGSNSMSSFVQVTVFSGFGWKLIQLKIFMFQYKYPFEILYQI